MTASPREIALEVLRKAGETEMQETCQTFEKTYSSDQQKLLVAQSMFRIEQLFRCITWIENQANYEGCP